MVDSHAEGLGSVGTRGARGLMGLMPQSAEPLRDTALHGSEAGLRCSVWAVEQAVDPIGSAGCVRGLLVVPWSLPWPADVGELEALSGVQARLDGLGIRIQATVPEGEDSPGRLRLYRPHPDGGPRLER